MVSPEIERVVGVHDAVDESDQQPARDQIGLPRDHGFEQRAVGALGLGGLRVVPGDDVIGQPPHALGIAARREILEGADANVAGGDPGQHRARQRHLAHHVLARDDGGERSRGGNAERSHRLADDVFAQHRPERGAAIAAPRKRRRAGPLELNVAAHAFGVDHLAEQDGAAVPELRDEMAELVAGIGHRDRIGAVGDPLAGEDLGSLGALEQVRIEAEMDRQRPVQLDQARRGDRGRRHAGEKARRQRRIGVLEGEMDRHGLKDRRARGIDNRLPRAPADGPDFRPLFRSRSWISAAKMGPAFGCRA